MKKPLKHKTTKRKRYGYKIYKTVDDVMIFLIDIMGTTPAPDIERATHIFPKKEWVTDQTIRNWRAYTVAVPNLVKARSVAKVFGYDLKFVKSNVGAVIQLDLHRSAVKRY